MTTLYTPTTNLLDGNPEQKRAEIRDYFLKTYALDEQLYTFLKTEKAFYRRADTLRHPLIFYYGHTAVFYINKLILAKIIDTRINPRFESIFAIGVDEMSWDDLDESNYDWPSLDEVDAYRQKVKNVVLDVIDNTPLELPVNWENPFWIIMMGIEHERIHIETSSVLIRQLPLELITPDIFDLPLAERGEAPENSMLPLSGGEVLLGKPQQHRFYGWDMEYGRYNVRVDDFKASQYLVSNGEFLQFIADGGYQTEEFWTTEGWQWKNYEQAAFPRFWRKTNDEYFLRLVDQEIKMPWNWPVELNYLEAKAYANWKSKKEGKSYRLPTEAEWYYLAQQCGITDENFHEQDANIALSKFVSPCPVNQFKSGDFYDVIGNVWQWTETPVTGFPGFKVHPMYDDFSTPTFDGKHNLIKGGSWISTGNEATWHARYAFRRHFYQHAGFRLVEAEKPLIIRNDSYETDQEVTQSCEFNYGQTIAGFENFPKQIAEICKKYAGTKADKKLLDLNCDTGRTVFELATSFQEITGIDFSARFIRMPIQMQEQGFIRYITKDEGELLFYRDVQLKDLGLAKTDNLQFMQADANNLKTIYSGYDVILAVNLLEELYAPDRLLSTIHERLNTNGILILGTTYDWESNSVKREHWPGGFKKDGEPLTSFEGISTLLEPNFELVAPPKNLHAAYPLSSRKYQVSVPEISVWKKR
ncbi:5-histidylcysteine sulfoxide synthase [uncultured Draconibacterium sp.]|uniref:5-histidylcysteine sulfoxide synthase n=1 Tax=uncultured Draconibacterium sp. TaxID=1573823 RepID=UPI00325FE6E4